VRIGVETKSSKSSNELYGFDTVVLGGLENRALLDEVDEEKLESYRDAAEGRATVEEWKSENSSSLSNMAWADVSCNCAGVGIGGRLEFMIE
jgi:hypothetical protein